MFTIAFAPGRTELHSGLSRSSLPGMKYEYVLGCDFNYALAKARRIAKENRTWQDSQILVLYLIEQDGEWLLTQIPQTIYQARFKIPMKYAPAIVPGLQAEAIKMAAGGRPAEATASS